nr:hypothetical protein [Tanacetum cinerariifolium]
MYTFINTYDEECFYVDLDMVFHADMPDSKNHMKMMALWRFIVNRYAFDDNKMVKFKLIKLVSDTREMLQSPSSDGSTSGQSSGSGNKRERSVVIIDLPDYEYDTDEEDEAQNAKKALVGDDEDLSATKELVKVKIEHE